MTIINLTSNVSNGGSININPNQDPGSTVDSAYDLGVFNFNNGSVTVNQTIGYYDPADLYQFTVNQAGEYSFTLDGLSANAELFLFPKDNVVYTTELYYYSLDFWDGNVFDYPGYVDFVWDELLYDSALSYSTSLGTEAESINIELDPGTYYVGVDSYDGIETNYELDIADAII